MSMHIFHLKVTIQNRFFSFQRQCEGTECSYNHMIGEMSLCFISWYNTNLSTGVWIFLYRANSHPFALWITNCCTECVSLNKTNKLRTNQERFNNCYKSKPYIVLHNSVIWNLCTCVICKYTIANIFSNVAKNRTFKNVAKYHETDTLLARLKWYAL